MDELIIRLIADLDDAYARNDELQEELENAIHENRTLRDVGAEKCRKADDASREVEVIIRRVLVLEEEEENAPALGPHITDETAVDPSMPLAVEEEDTPAPNNQGHFNGGLDSAWASVLDVVEREDAKEKKELPPQTKQAQQARVTRNKINPMLQLTHMPICVPPTSGVAERRGQGQNAILYGHGEE